MPNFYLKKNAQGRWGAYSEKGAILRYAGNPLYIPDSTMEDIEFFKTKKAKIDYVHARKPDWFHIPAPVGFGKTKSALKYIGPGAPDGIAHRNRYYLTRAINRVPNTAVFIPENIRSGAKGASKDTILKNAARIVLAEQGLPVNTENVRHLYSTEVADEIRRVRAETNRGFQRTLRDISSNMYQNRKPYVKKAATLEKEAAYRRRKAEAMEIGEAFVERKYRPRRV